MLGNSSRFIIDNFSNYETIKKQSEEGFIDLKKRKHLRQCVYSSVNKVVLKCFAVVREKNISVSGVTIKEKAL